MAAKLRTIKNDDAWPRVGQTKDEGAGSRAKKMLALSAQDQAVVKKLKTVYDKMVPLLEKLDSDAQQAVCFAAASQYSWSLLVTKAQATKTAAIPTLTKSQQSMFDAIKASSGAAAADGWREMTLAAKAAMRSAKK